MRSLFSRPLLVVDPRADRSAEWDQLFASTACRMQAVPTVDRALACLPANTPGAILVLPGFPAAEVERLAAAARTLPSPPVFLSLVDAAEERLLHGLLEAVHQIIFIKDARTGRYLHLNHQGEVALGLSTAQILGRRDEEVFPPERAAAYVAKDQEALLGRGPVVTEEDRVEFPGEGTRTLTTRKVGVYDERGEPLFLIGVSEDVTELRRAEQAKIQRLREQAEIKVRESAARRMAFLAEASTLLASTLDYRRALPKLSRVAVPALADWAIVSWHENGSRRSSVAHRRGPAEPELRSLGEILLETEPGPFGEMLRGGRPGFWPALDERNLAHLLGDPALAHRLEALGGRSLLAVPILSRGQNHGYFLLGQGSSGRHFRQEDLALAEELGRRAGHAVDNALLFETAQRAVEIRDNFLSIASHELKTPITSLKLHLQMTRRKLLHATERPPDLSSLADVLGRSEQQVNRLARLVDDLLDVSRIEAGKFALSPEPMDLGSLVLDVVERYREQARGVGSELTVRVEEGCHLVADPARIEQIVVNLVSNALKYGAGRPVELAVGREGDRLYCRVRDYGMGIRPERIGKIFERFERAEKHAGISGLGLGLYIVRTIAEAHGGHVDVESRVGEGSVFTLWLPALPARAEAAG